MSNQTVALLGAFEALPTADRQNFAVEVLRRSHTDQWEPRSSYLSTFLPVVAHTLAVFGDETKAGHWLATPLPFFHDRSPAEILQEPGGIALVEQTLTRIEHNIPS